MATTGPFDVDCASSILAYPPRFPVLIFLLLAVISYAAQSHILVLDPPTTKRDSGPCRDRQVPLRVGIPDGGEARHLFRR